MSNIIKKVFNNWIKESRIKYIKDLEFGVS